MMSKDTTSGKKSNVMATNQTQYFTCCIPGRKFTTYRCRYCEKDVFIKTDVYYICGWCGGKFCDSCWDDEEVVEQRTCDNCAKTFCDFCTKLHNCPKFNAKFCGLCTRKHRFDHDEITIQQMKADEKKGAELVIPDNKSFGSDFYDY